MSDWARDLYRELDQWNFDGVAATFWWRDDDARAPSDELTKLAELSARYRAPLSLAVIPANLDASLARELPSEKSVGKSPAEISVLQHGYAHTNHAPPGEKKCEFGAARDPAEVRRELADGNRVLQETFGARFVPAFAPPWNRIAPQWLEFLRPSGLRGLTTFGARTARQAAPEIAAANTHADIIDWKNGKRFLGAARATADLCAHLAARRNGDVDPAEPSGLLTHHLAHDADSWAFLADFLGALDEHPAVKWLPARAVFQV